MASPVHKSDNHGQNMVQKVGSFLCMRCVNSISPGTQVAKVYIVSAGSRGGCIICTQLHMHFNSYMKCSEAGKLLLRAAQGLLRICTIAQRCNYDFPKSKRGIVTIIWCTYILTPLYGMHPFSKPWPPSKREHFPE